MASFLSLLDREERAKQSFQHPYVQEAVSEKWQAGREAIASNVKMGPFIASSGISLPYYLNVTTNFLDKRFARNLVDLIATMIEGPVRENVEAFGSDSLPLCVGMEVAGGIMVSQLAARGSSLDSWCDFVYMRKAKKKTGTCQQLEGPQHITARGSHSPPIPAIWVDDALSTGSSMLEGIITLREDYNIHVVAAVYLVDRSQDRQNLEESRQAIANPAFDTVSIYAVYSMDDIDSLIPSIEGSSK